MEKKQTEWKVKDINQWLLGYRFGDLPHVQAMVNEYKARAVVFECACCGKMSAFLDCPERLLLAVSHDTKEEANAWLKEEGFTIVGELPKGSSFDSPISYYN